RYLKRYSAGGSSTDSHGGDTKSRFVVGKRESGARPARDASLLLHRSFAVLNVRAAYGDVRVKGALARGIIGVQEIGQRIHAVHNLHAGGNLPGITVKIFTQVPAQRIEQVVADRAHCITGGAGPKHGK